MCALLPGLLGATSDRAATDAGLADFRAARFAEAFEAWQASAERGSAHGALYLGVLFDTGLGVNRDRAQAAAWYRRAAGLGSAAAAFNLGVLYDAGLLGPGNATDAAKWYGIAAAQHFPRAEYNLAMLYEAGEDGVKRSPALAIGLYQRAAAHGIAAARAHLTALGAPYAGGSAHVAADSGMDDFRRAQQILLARGAARTRQATGLLQSAAQQHNPPAEYDLGYCYQYGIGIAADRGQALVWYRRAAADARDATLRALAQTAAQGVVP